MKISMVTTVLNRSDLIEEALSSVRKQAGAEVEHIVVDAGSTDGTREILAMHPELRIIDLQGSTPEEAMNEGIRWATGDVVGFIMSDDRLAPGILSAVADAFEQHPECDVVSAGATFFTNDESGHDIILRTYERRAAIDLDYLIVLLGPLMACARFYRRNLFDRVGTFEPTYRTCNDRDLLWRMILVGVRNFCLERVAYMYRSHPGSRTLSGEGDRAYEIAMEHLRMAEDYFAHKNLSTVHRREILRFHAVESARGAFRALRAGRFVDAVKVIARGFRQSPLFPMVAVKEIRKLRQRLRVE